MIRTITAAALVALLSTSAFAGGHYTKKKCMAQNLKGQHVSFVCKIDEVCCYNKLMDKSSCGKRGVLKLGSKAVCK